jgi:hypothetical protein
VLRFHPHNAPLVILLGIGSTHMNRRHSNICMHPELYLGLGAVVPLTADSESDAQGDNGDTPAIVELRSKASALRAEAARALTRSAATRGSARAARKASEVVWTAVVRFALCGGVRKRKLLIEHFSSSVRPIRCMRKQFEKDESWTRVGQELDKRKKNVSKSESESPSWRSASSFRSSITSCLESI